MYQALICVLTSAIISIIIVESRCDLHLKEMSTLVDETVKNIKKTTDAIFDNLKK